MTKQALTLSLIEESRDVERDEELLERAREQAAWHAERRTAHAAHAAASWIELRDGRPTLAGFGDAADLTEDSREAGLLVAEVEYLRSGYPRGDLGRGLLPADREPPHAHDTSLLCGLRLLPEETRRPFRMDAYNTEIALDALTTPTI